MKDTLICTYKRESTLWKHASAPYRSTDWVRMECLFSDYTEERDFAKEVGITIKQGDTDVTKERFADKYVVRLMNVRHEEKEYCFVDKNEANALVKKMLNHKILKGWHKV